MKQLMSVYSIQAKLFLRDKIVLVVTLGLPLLLAIFFSIFFGNIQNGVIKIALIGRGIEGIESSKNVQFKEYQDKDIAIEELINKEINMVMVFPGELGSPVQVYHNSNNTGLDSASLLIKDLMLSEMNLKLNGGEKILVSVDTDVADGKHSLAEYYIPNFLAMSILWLSVLSISITLVKQRESKVLLRLGLTPLHRWKFMLGFTLWRMTIGLAQCVLFFIVCSVLFEIDVAKVLPLFLLASIVGNLAFIALGYFIAALSDNVEKAEGIGQAVNIGFMLLSGVFVEVEMLPSIFEKISYVIPMNYMADLFRQSLFGYRGGFPLWLDFGALVLCAVVCFGVSIKKWRWQ